MNTKQIHYDNPNGIMCRQTIASMCLAYTDAVRDIREGFRLIGLADDRGRTAFGDRSGLPWLKADADGCVQGLTRNAWHYIVEQSNILEMCSIKQAKEIEEQIEKNELPDITEANVWAFIEKVQRDLPSMVQQAVAEVFKILTPGANERGGYWAKYTHKTNAASKWEVPAKLILDHYIDPGYMGHWSVNHYDEQNLRAIDNVFSLLDGKGVAKYPTDLLTTINGALKENVHTCETAYFACKMFGKGTLHIRIKRDDLRKELNRIAGRLTMKEYVATGQEITRI
jgi:hypothetical protein